jgi:hypothetical protein
MGRRWSNATVKAISSWKAGEQRSMLTLLQDVSLEIILRAIFGVSDSALAGGGAAMFCKMVLAYTAPLVIVPWTRVDSGSVESVWSLCAHDARWCMTGWTRRSPIGATTPIRIAPMSCLRWCWVAKEQSPLSLMRRSAIS